jgi:hypothetical protein
MRAKRKILKFNVGNKKPMLRDTCGVHSGAAENAT